MRGKNLVWGVRGVVLVNLQKRYGVRTVSLAAFVRSLKRQMRLGSREFNICFVDDHAIRQLNSAYRGRDKATDVLSFPWNEAAGGQWPQPSGTAVPALRTSGTPVPPGLPGRITNFLGDVVISVETARRNARAEGHSTLNEICWLALHGVLHLLGYDHMRDSGEMIELELALREQLGVAGGRKRKVETRKSKLETRKSKSPRRTD
ncbi:MAG TPA: rRNA maturation RNase YbeY [Terriglobia bacterium]|nr:rRNA maturation RNase YbeY [Terriglobia bacterium]